MKSQLWKWSGSLKHDFVMKLSWEVAQAWLDWAVSWRPAVLHEHHMRREHSHHFQWLYIHWVICSPVNLIHVFSVLWGEASKSPPRAYRIYTFPLETMIWYGGNFLKTVYFPSDRHIATKFAVVSEVIGIPLKKGLPKSAKILRKKREGPAGNRSILELTCCDPRHAFIWKTKNQVPSWVRSNMMV